jgi:iron complex transport system permease protein
MGETDSVSGTDIKETYSKYTKRKILFIAICLIVSFIAVGSSVTVGGRTLSVFDVYDIIFKHLTGVHFEVGTKEWLDDYIVWDIRLPRAIFAIIAGAGLAISGAVMQSVMKNPLADPYITGISSGACFGVAIAAVLGISVMNGSFSGGAVFNAFIFSLIPMLAILFLSPMSRSSPATLILAGVAISYMFNAMTTILLSFTDSETLATIYSWQIGSLSNITWDCILIPLVITIIGSSIMMLLSKKLNILSMGDDQAKALGLNAENLRILMLVLISLIVASVVAYAGIIGFVGLVSPHIVRMLIDGDNRFVIPASALFGASFLLICDVLTRLISDVEAVPVGVVVSFIGAPIFLYMIIRQSKGMW